MKKSVVLTTTAASIGLATVLTLSAVAPSMAKTSSHSTTTTTKSAAAKTSSSGNQGGVSFSTTQDARKFTSVNFTVSNVPSTITDAATAAKLLVVKVVPLAADATSAPATAPLPAGRMGDDHGAWTPSGTTTGTTPTPSATPSASATPATGTAPTFGDNDGDGPQAGQGGRGHGKGHGKGPRGGMQISNLTLTNGVLTGTIQLPGDEVAGVQKFGIYLNIAASTPDGITAQNATPVMVTVTTAADLTPTVTATTGAVTLAITK